MTHARAADLRCAPVIGPTVKNYLSNYLARRLVPTMMGFDPLWQLLHEADAVAAFRAGNAPHIMQVFEVGTATMMAATGAVKPVYKLMAEAGETFDPKS